MKESNDRFVRADQIDLKSLDEQLERHLNRAWTTEKNKKKQDFDDFAPTPTTAISASPSCKSPEAVRSEWHFLQQAAKAVAGGSEGGTSGQVSRSAVEV